jgi:CMP-N,N'-diacetyllegionaminic acid synthase
VKIIALVTARSGSKGLPGKNTMLFAGKPLIAWSIEAALGVRDVRSVVCSTDSAEIAAIARTHGAETPFLRPPELALDESPHVDVVEHALDWLSTRGIVEREDFLLLLQPTSPLRETADIERAICLQKETAAPAVLSVSPAKPHPLLSRSMDAGGRLAHYFPGTDGGLPRQLMDLAYYLNGAIYLNRIRDFLTHRVFMVPGSVGYVMPPERSVDIDSAFDFDYAQFLKNRSSA